MHAEEARRLTQEHFHRVNVEPHLKAILKEIEAAALKGENSISDPLSKSRMVSPTDKEWDAIYTQLCVNDYRVERKGSRITSIGW